MRALLGSLGAIVVAAWSAQAAAGDAPAEPTGLEIFTRDDQIVEVVLSPSGTRLAAVKLDKGRRGLAVIDLSNRKLMQFFKPSGPTGVGGVHWAGDDRLVLEMVEHEGDLASPKQTGELYGIAADGTGGRMIFGYRAGEKQTGSHIRKGEKDRASASVVSRIRGDARKILIESRQWNEVRDRVVWVYKLDAVTGLKDLVTTGPIREAWFIADEEGQPRLACGFTTPPHMRCFVRDPGKDWAERVGVEAEAPMAVSSRERTLYVSAPDGKGYGVFAVNLDSGERKLLARDDLVPPSSWVLDSAHRLVAVEFTPDLPHYEFVLPDHPFARALAGLEPSFPGEHIRLVSRSDDDAKIVVKVFSDRDPGRYLVVDVKTMTGEPVGDVRPWVKPADMAEMSAFHIPARDGFRIHGYVTLPRAPATAPFPMVVLPHGGPHQVRNTWRFDREAQLLAHEGFAVLQVNYRGSYGYGMPYELAGYGHWGDRMIEDIADATRFAIRKGWANPRRICIYGASFGGYAALQSAVIAPELYRCAVGYAGVYDLEREIGREETITSGTDQRYYRSAMGSSSDDLNRASPAYHADRITVPVMLIHGEEDRRAPFDQAKRMRDALTAQGRPPEWLAEPREGHGFYDEATRERMYARLVEFLRRHTAPQSEPEKDAPAGTP